MFNVNYSLKRDVDNYLNSVWKFRYLKHGREGISGDLVKQFPQDFIEGLKKIKRKHEASKFVRTFLQSQHPFLAEYIRRVGKHLQVALDEERPKIVRKLEDVYNKKFPFNKIDVFITTLKICPYDFRKRWFMVSVYGNPKNHVNTALHELNHFMFYHYFGCLKEKLGKEKFESLKEALTVFTNPEEKGYPAQEKLRAWLVAQKGSISEIVANGEWKTLL